MSATNEDHKGLTPNDVFRHLRKTYLVCVAVAVPLLFLAFYLNAERAAPLLVCGLLLVAGLGLLVFALRVRSRARCPRCQAPLMWQKSPIRGAGRVSIREKTQCPGCALDLNAPWPPEDHGASPSASPAATNTVR